MTSPGREFRMEIVLPASVERVWRALSDGEELSRWFPIDAKVTPPTGGEAGKLWLSWSTRPDDGMSWETKIREWEPLKHIGYTNEQPGPMNGGPSEEPGPRLISVDFYLEGRGGETVLRLVHSGFGRGQGWDDELDSITNGWKFELRSLRHYLRYHGGGSPDAGSRGVIYVPRVSPLAPAESHARLTGPEGWNVRSGAGAIGATPMREGEAYEFVGPTGQRYHGTVLSHVPRRSFAGTVEELGNGLVRFESERAPKGSGPFVWLSVWGAQRAAVPGLREAWIAAMDRLFAKQG